MTCLAPLFSSGGRRFSTSTISHVNVTICFTITLSRVMLAALACTHKKTRDVQYAFWVPTPRNETTMVVLCQMLL